MPPTDRYLQGALSTVNVDTDIQPGEWAQHIHDIIPAGKAPFAAIMMVAASQPVHSKTYHWPVQPFPEQRGTISAITTTAGGSAYASGAIQGTPLFLTMDDDDARQIVPSHVIMMTDATTGSYFQARVEDVTIQPGGSGYVTITMLEADNVANDLADVDSFWLMTQTQAEGGDMPIALQRQPTWFSNDTMIVAAATGLTGTEMVELERISPDKRARARADGALRSAIEMEKAAIFSKRVKLYKNGEEIRYTEGIVPSIVANAPGNVFNHVTDTDTALGTWANTGWYFLTKKFEILFRYSETNRKTAFIGTEGLQAIQQAVETKAAAGIKLETRQSSFGIAITTLVTVFGEIDLILDPLFTTNPQWRKSMLVIEIPLIKYCPLAGREWRFLPSQHDPNVNFGPDRVNEGWRGEFGMKVLNHDALGWFVNLGMDNV